MPSYAVTRGASTHTAHVQEGRPFPVPAKSTLLMAALDAGLDWPYGCRVGLCGRCRCKLLHGKVSPIGDVGDALGPQAESAGYILACRSLLDSNVLVLPPEHAAGPDRDLVGTIVRLAQPTPEVVQLTVDLERPYRVAYQAGQYARLSVPDDVPPRCFSYAGACRGDGRLDFHVRLFPGGKLAEWLLAGDRIGAKLAVSQPLGEPALPALGEAVGIVFVAGGTGIAPVLALLEELAALPAPSPPVTVVYAARDQAHLYMASRLDALAASFGGPGDLRFCPVLSREPAGSSWTGLRGHVFDHLDALLPDPAGRRAYLCGPPGLVDATELALLKRGWPRAAVTAERFLPAFA
ncbi:MAG: 2Fe-2S iron-sulfur cluster-binding protein [Gammaproteobacteria bacterium]